MKTSNEIRVSQLLSNIEKNHKILENTADISQFFDFLRNYIQEGDWDIAVETLSDFLLEHKVFITQAEFDEMIDLLGFLDSKYVLKSRSLLSQRVLSE